MRVERRGEVSSRTAFGMSGKIWKIDLTIVCVRACGETGKVAGTRVFLFPASMRL